MPTRKAHAPVIGERNGARKSDGDDHKVGAVAPYFLGTDLPAQDANPHAHFHNLRKTLARANSPNKQGRAAVAKSQRERAVNLQGFMATPL